MKRVYIITKQADPPRHTPQSLQEWAEDCKEAVKGRGGDVEVLIVAHTGIVLDAMTQGVVVNTVLYLTIDVIADAQDFRQRNPSPELRVVVFTGSSSFPEGARDGIHFFTKQNLNAKRIVRAILGE